VIPRTVGGISESPSPPAASMVSGIRTNTLLGPFVIQCGVPSLILAWYTTLLAGTWALVMRLRGGEGLEACPPPL
jgi:hypothetical protein